MSTKILPYILIGLVLTLCSGCSKDSTTTDDNGNITPTTTVNDVDGNSYKIVVIGTQTWMAENPKTTKYNNGTDIPLVTDAKKWQEADNSTGGYCWYNNDISNKDAYGALYSSWVADTDRLCPSGWRLPISTDLVNLSYKKGGLKETGTTYWTAPNAGAPNSTGFSARAGGQRTTSGFFDENKINGNF